MRKGCQLREAAGREVPGGDAGEYVQLNQEVVQQVEQLVAQMKIILDKKKTEADAYLGSNRPLEKIGNVEEFLTTYN